ncbi:MAG: helix-turn-helix domain-containing protein [Raineya sp.]|nr:helix-turn-helix domain-containing protein [Raineya sp.]
MLSQKEYEVLREIERNERQVRAYKKVTVLLMLHQDYSVEEIAICLGISEGTVWNYKKQYEQEGIEKYLEDNYKAYTGKLSKEQEGVGGGIRAKFVS